MWPRLRRGGGGDPGSAHGEGRPGEGEGEGEGKGVFERLMPDQRGPGLLGRSARGRRYASRGSGAWRVRHTSRHVPPGTSSKPPTYHSHPGGCEATRRADTVRTNPPSAEASHSSIGSSSSDEATLVPCIKEQSCNLWRRCEVCVGACAACAEGAEGTIVGVMSVTPRRGI